MGRSIPTQGNWYTNDGQIISEETGKTLAIIPYFDKYNWEQQANAKLMSKAKDLKNALEALSNIFEALVKDSGNPNKPEEFATLRRAQEVLNETNDF